MTMLKVFIAEDEPLIRDSLRKMVESFETRFDVEYSGEASDGEIALSMIQEIKPDILLTDIRMPFMDGLTLAKYAKELIPWLQIVIISGFEDFEYSKEAIKIGVQGYITKPIQQSELAEVIEKIQNQLQQNQLQQNQPDNLVELANNEYYKEHFFSKLRSSGYFPAEIYQREERLQFKFLGGSFAILYGHFEPDDRSKKTYNQLLVTFNELFGEDPQILLTTFDDFTFCALISEENIEKALNRSYYTADIIKYELEKIPNQGYQLYIGETTNRLSELGQRIDRTIQTAKLLPFDRKKTIIELTAPDRSSLEELINQERFAELIDEKQIQFDAVWNFLKETLASLSGQKQQLTRQGVLDYLLANIKSYDDTLFQKLDNEYETEDKLIITQSDSLFKLTLRLFLEELQKTRNVNKQKDSGSRAEQLIQRTKSYMKENFDDPNLSLQSMAEKLNLSPAYLSTIFSQNEGVTFIESLTGLRMDRAKELLARTSKKIIDITFEIGYNDPNYFSFIFKKRNGVTPKEYRQKTEQPK